jgi:hypothetical protein
VYFFHLSFDRGEFANIGIKLNYTHNYDTKLKMLITLPVLKLIPKENYFPKHYLVFDFNT